MKTVFITGASSGIGKETAIYFHNKGWNVVATMRKPEQENQLINLKNVTCLYLDVLDEQSIKEAVFVAINSFGKIDVLINNAGYSALGVFESASNDQIKRQFDTNVFGLMNVTREILPHFRENKSGTVVNIASVAGRMGFPLFSLYNGTKWAVEGFSEALYYELKKLGIKVKIIEPGPIKTDFYGRSMDITKKDNLTDYNEIVDKPKETIEGIYKFLGIPKFKHRFKNFKQVEVNGLKYDDNIFGKGMHTIKTKRLTKTKRDIKKILPKEIIDTYGKIQFV